MAIACSSSTVAEDWTMTTTAYFDFERHCFMLRAAIFLIRKVVFDRVRPTRCLLIHSLHRMIGVRTFQIRAGSIESNQLPYSASCPCSGSLCRFSLTKQTDNSLGMHGFFQRLSKYTIRPSVSVGVLTPISTWLTGNPT